MFSTQERQRDGLEIWGSEAQRRSPKPPPESLFSCLRAQREKSKGPWKFWAGNQGGAEAPSTPKGSTL